MGDVIPRADKASLKKKRIKNPESMQKTNRLPDTSQAESADSPDSSEDRRSHHREKGVLSHIEDITYKVLRQHEPKKP